jgi:signal transduction histidine kinase
MLETALLLGDRGIIGLVLMDCGLIVRRRYGLLAEFVREGVHVAESVLPLVGLDEQLLELRDRVDATLEVPAVVIHGGGAPESRLNLTGFWLASRRQFLLLISRAENHAGVELQMSRLMRARLMAEAEATARAKELTRVNRDLDEFASIVAHDLKSPMRAIRYLADDLERALGDRAAGDPAMLLARIREQSRRMTLMLSQLHAYARAGYKQSVAESVDTLALVAGIVRSLPRPAGLRVEISGDWPRVVTLASLLDLVIRNLVENAIKHHDRDEGMIKVCGRPGPRALDIEVSDDGPGIAPEHHEAAFQPFRTLQPGPDGGGMGLAFVKKAVEGVGGRITLASDPAARRGASFQVAWPLLASA